MHDNHQPLRLRAANFLTHLMRDNSSVAEWVAVMQGWEVQHGLRKYVIGGLGAYHLTQNQFQGT